MSDSTRSDTTRFDGLPVTASTLRPRPDICLIRLAGEIDAATTAPLADYLREQTSTGPAHLVLDLADVSFLAAAGVGLILSATHDSSGIRGSTHLIGVLGHPIVARVLDLTGALPLLDIHDHLDDLLHHLDYLDRPPDPPDQKPASPEVTRRGGGSGLGASSGR